MRHGPRSAVAACNSRLPFSPHPRERHCHLILGHERLTTKYTNDTKEELISVVCGSLPTCCHACTICFRGSLALPPRFRNVRRSGPLRGAAAEPPWSASD